MRSANNKQEQIIWKVLHQMKMNQSVTSGILSYRNAYYQGEMKDFVRHGSGMLIIDEGPIMVANWKQDLAFGSAFVFLNSDEHAFLQFNRGQLEGTCLFRSGATLLVMQFSNGRAIDRHIIINHDENNLKLLTYRNANYEVLDSAQISGRSQSKIIEEYLGLKNQCPTLIDYLQGNFCKAGQMFEIKVLPNATKLFRFNDKRFILGKNDQLTSYGEFLNEKLHGFGCKYENNAKYQGRFENGFLNGEGMRYSNGKYSYGRFQNGNLVEALFLQQRSTASQERLRELRRINHLESPTFFNGYVKKGLLRFKGITEITSMSSPVKEYLYNQFGQKQQEPQQNLKNSQMSLNQILSAKNNNDYVETKSLLNSSQASRGRNPEDLQQLQVQRANNLRSSGVGSGRKFNF